MSHIEQAGYPYVPKSHGIPFERASIGLPDVYLVGGSGSLLEYCINDRVIEVTDTENTRLQLVASINRNERLIFNLRTRTGENGSTLRHPDLFAAKFVAFAIRNFELLGREVHFWRAIWKGMKSDNYRQFTDRYSLSGDLLTAARSTWTGGVAQSHGFVIEDELDITWNEVEEKVIVEFQR